MKSVREALEQMMPAFVPIGTERLAIGEALGRCLGEDVLARFDLPPFDNSSMDGYAVRAAETAGPRRVLPLAGESAAGGAAPLPLAPGTTMRIFTGAMLPAGADAVVMQEDTTALGEQITFGKDVKPGNFVRRRGSDLVGGGMMLARGQRIGAGEIGLLAAQRIAAVTVTRRPRVAIVSTGDELRDLDGAPAAGSIVNSNAYALAAMVREAGGEPLVLPNVPDRLDATIDALRAALTADVVLTVGGVSVGDYDFVKAAFDAVGIAAGFWKVRIKPGKPLVFGLRGTTPVVGLPGNPMSAMVTFEALVRPGLRAMLGDPRPHRVVHEVALARDHRHGTGRLELARATLAHEGGRLVATPLRQQDSGSLPSWVSVDALLLLPEDQATFAAGELVKAILVRDDTGSAETPFA
ncbi:MAG: Molybdopterin biosynthesis protein MoeA [Labilithrix sp.]|nr:Molybdopterin biosynthesis protein MoeA [Labilithrix sp.]